MSLLQQDVPWLVSEARNDPDTAQQIIEALSSRVAELQQQTDELRAENVLLKRGGSHHVFQDQVQRLRTDLRDLRTLAEKASLNPDVVTILSFTGHALHLPAPLAMDQTLALELPSGESVRDLRPLFMTSAARLHSVLCLSSSFRLIAINGLSVPLSEAMTWQDARAVVPLGRGERVEATCVLDELQPPRRLIVVSRRGWVRAMSWQLVENLIVSGQPITPPDANDSLVWVSPAEEGDLLLLTRNGRWTRFPINAIEPSGSQGVSLGADDDVACGCVVRPTDSAAYFVGGDGAEIAVAASGLEAHKKPGAKAVPLKGRFVTLACFAAKKTDAIMHLATSGDLIVETIRALPVGARPSEAQGLNVINQRLVASALLK